MKNIIKECPYCGSAMVESAGKGEFHCLECATYFSAVDFEREDLRHKISALLEGTSEDSPKEIHFMIPSAEEEAQGLSSLEIPHIDKIFEVAGDGTIWYHIEGERGLCGGEPIWNDLDTLEVSDLRGLLNYLKEN